jgi:hypothetical protein
LYLDLLLIFGAFFGTTTWSFVYLGAMGLPLRSGPVHIFSMAVGILLGAWVLSVLVWSWMSNAPHGSWQGGAPAIDFTNRWERQGDFPDLYMMAQANVLKRMNTLA